MSASAARGGRLRQGSDRAPDRLRWAAAAGLVGQWLGELTERQTQLQLLMDVGLYTGHKPGNPVQHPSKTGH